MNLNAGAGWGSVSRSGPGLSYLGQIQETGSGRISTRFHCGYQIGYWLTFQQPDG